MAEVRAVLVMVPPFLADLIRHVVDTRVPALGITLSKAADFGESPHKLDAHIAIVGPAGDAAARIAASVGPHTRVLTLSGKLDLILGPNPGDSAPLTPDTLADRLRCIVREM